MPYFPSNHVVFVIHYIFDPWFDPTTTAYPPLVTPTRPCHQSFFNNALPSLYVSIAGECSRDCECDTNCDGIVNAGCPAGRDLAKFRKQCGPKQCNCRIARIRTGKPRVCMKPPEMCENTGVFATTAPTAGKYETHYYVQWSCFCGRHELTTSFNKINKNQ